MKNMYLHGLALSLLPATATAQWLPVNDPGEFEGIELFLPGEDRLYAGSSSGLVFSSVDHGENWTEEAGGLFSEYAPVQSLIIADQWMIMSRWFFDEFNYRSQFNGQTWEAFSPLPYQENPILNLIKIDATLFGIFTGGEIHRSDDYGDTWTPIVISESGRVDRIFTFEGKLFASNQMINEGQVYRSGDLGETWAAIGEPLGSSYLCSQIYWQDQLLVCAYHYGGDGTFWSSRDFGDNWQQITTLPTDYNINGMAIADDGRLAIGAVSGYPDHASIWLSHDLETWMDYTGDLPQVAWSFSSLDSYDGWFFKSGGSVRRYRAPHPCELDFAVGDHPEQVSRGELVALTGRLSNQCNEPMSFDTVWLEARAERSLRRQIYAGPTQSLAAGSFVNGALELTVPRRAPIDEYTISILVYRQDVLIAVDRFDLLVTD